MAANLIGCSDISDSLRGKHESVKKINSDSKIDMKSINESDELSFTNIKKRILDNNCINCHTGKHNNFDSYAIVSISAQEIINRITTNNFIKRMPAGRDALNEDLINLFQAWVDAGTPEFADPINQEVINDTKYSFADIKQNVFEPNNCFKCHSHFNDYETVIKNIGAIAGSIKNDKMPYPIKKEGEVNALTLEQKEILFSWIDQGAPRFVNEKYEFKNEPLLPNWYSLRNNLFGPKCILCHNSYGKRGPNDLSSYESLMAWYEKSPKLFDINNPEESHFIGAIIGRVDSDELYFDTMPFDSPQDDVEPLPAVTEEELSVIKEWIGLGLPIN